MSIKQVQQVAHNETHTLFPRTFSAFRRKLNQCMNPADNQRNANLKITCSVSSLRTSRFFVCQHKSYAFSFLAKIPGGRHVFLLFYPTIFVCSFWVFIRKQGWRWKQALNKLLLRILQPLQSLLRRLGENGFLPQFCAAENKHVFC